ncbi:DegT/DnrJ/EryC1/StrS family aminotransferase [Actinomadura sp. 7K534]|uniref:DegT/DnrJ/EryC1/StrS family aminotransferase n=1 Tax=Actinomadura sp. 7K534 TaxID=2530366 RepID=UPI00104B326D|nr:DegT/DnrJ/EryC1/StrS family aminotransferase [Actinomadura sp. 7K534]TDB98870.1 DegT/DnrJ/EryC1/StrS family aminotransferase [Actinomadura sp. 7K534]
MINVFQPTLGAEELGAVAEVLDGAWLGKGPRVAEFERAFAEHLGVPADRVVTVNSCTEALFQAMELLGVGPGDEVVLPSISFVGAANAIAAQGARPVFCDVDPRTLNPTADHVAAALGPRTRAVIVLHYGGRPGSVLEIAELCRDRGVPLVEDAACSVASRAGDDPCGVIGDIGVWSFDSQKIVVTADGAMLSARDPELVATARKHTYLGLERFSGYTSAKVADTRWWDIEVTSFSRRSIMNDLQAALGLVQLRRLGGFLERRAEIAAAYDRELAGLAGMQTPPPLPDGHTSSFYLYWVQVDEAVRDALARDLYADGVYTTFRYPALHLVKAYGSDARLPGAEAAAARTLCLPLHQGLSDGDVEVTIAAVRSSVRRRSGRLPPPPSATTA